MFIVLVMGMQTQSLQIYIFRTEARGETSSGAFGTSLKAPLPLQDY